MKPGISFHRFSWSLQQSWIIMISGRARCPHFFQDSTAVAEVHQKNTASPTPEYGSPCLTLRKEPWMMCAISKVASVCHCSIIAFFAKATMLFGTLHILKLDNLDQMLRGFKISKLLRHPPMTYESVYSMSVYIVRRTNLKELQCIRLQKWKSLLQSPSLTWMGHLHSLHQHADIQSPRAQADADCPTVTFDEKHEVISEAILQHCSIWNCFQLGTHPNNNGQKDARCKMQDEADHCEKTAKHVSWCKKWTSTWSKSLPLRLAVCPSVKDFMMIHSWSTSDSPAKRGSPVWISISIQPAVCLSNFTSIAKFSIYCK